jgi:HK97 family phage major capsid protein
MNLKPQYMASKSIQWLLHRTVLQSLMLEKASTAGTYLFTPGLAVDMPNMILGVPYRLSENAPSTLTTGLYVALLGDFRWYWIANSMEFEVQVLNELYALNDYIGYIGRLWSDGMPVLEEAFSRLKLA